MKMTPKQKKFCDEYLIDLNATQAAIRAGYSEKSARQIADENLAKPYIKEAIQAATRERSERTQIHADDVLRDIQAVKNCAMAYRQDKDGTDVMTDMGAALKALEMLGRHLCMFTDKREITGADGGAIQARIELGFVKP